MNNVTYRGLTENMKEFFRDQIATLQGKRYGDDTIIIGFGGYPSKEVERQDKAAFTGLNGIEEDYISDEITLEEWVKLNQPDPYEKLVHPRDRDRSEFGCGMAYLHAVNDYYEHERRRKLLILKKHLPLIIGGGILGGAIGLTLKALLTK